MLPILNLTVVIARSSSRICNVCGKFIIGFCLFLFTYSGMVYKDAEVLYAEVKRDGEAILEDAFSALLPASVPVLPAMRTKSLGGSSKILAFNTTFLPRWDIVRIPSLSKAGPGLKSLILQASEDGKEGYAIMHCPGGGAIGELKHPSSGLHELIKPVSGEWSRILFTSRKFDARCIFSLYKWIRPFRPQECKRAADNF